MAYSITPSSTSNSQLQDSVVVAIDDGDRLSYYEHDLKDNMVKALGLSNIQCLPLYETSGYKSTNDNINKLADGDLNLISAILNIGVDDDSSFVRTISVKFKHTSEVLDTNNMLVNSLYITAPYLRDSFKLFSDGATYFDNALKRENSDYYYLYHYKDQHVYYPHKSMQDGTTLYPVLDRLMLTTGIINATFDHLYEQKYVTVKDIITAVKSRFSLLSDKLHPTIMKSIMANTTWNDSYSMVSALKGIIDSFSNKEDAYYSLSKIISNLLTKETIDTYKQIKPDELKKHFDSIISSNTFNFIDKTKIYTDQLIPSITSDVSDFIMFNSNSENIASFTTTEFYTLLNKIKSNPGAYLQDPLVSIFSSTHTENHKRLFALLFYIHIVHIHNIFQLLSSVIIDLLLSEYNAWYEILNGQILALIDDDSDLTKISNQFNTTLRDLGLLGAVIGKYDDYSNSQIRSKRVADFPYSEVYDMESNHQSYKSRYTEIENKYMWSDAAFFYFKEAADNKTEDVYFPYGNDDITLGFVNVVQNGKVHIVPMFNSTPTKCEIRNTDNTTNEFRYIGKASGSITEPYRKSITTVIADKIAMDTLTGRMELIAVVMGEILNNKSSILYPDSDINSKIATLMSLCNISNVPAKTGSLDIVNTIKKILDSNSISERLNLIIPFVKPVDKKEYTTTKTDTTSNTNDIPTVQLSYTDALEPDIPMDPETDIIPFNTTPILFPSTPNQIPVTEQTVMIPTVENKNSVSYGAAQYDKRDDIER